MVKNSIHKTIIEKKTGLNALRNGLKLLDYIEPSKYELDGDSAIYVPENGLIALHILYLQNSDFLTMLKNPRKNIHHYKNVIEFGKLFDNYNEANIYGYVYERLTGVNIALLFGNYYKKMVKYVSLKEIAVHSFVTDSERTVKGQYTDNRWYESGLSECMERLQERLEKLLTEIMKMSITFGRIIFADIILQLICIYVERYINPYMVTFMGTEIVYAGISNRTVSEYMFEIIGDVVEMLKEPETLSRLERSNILYDELKKEIEIYLDKEEKTIDLWKEVEEGEYNNWEYISYEMKKIIRRREKGVLVSHTDLGKYVKEEIKRKKDEPNAKLPVIFIDEGIIESRENEESACRFLKCALTESHNGNKNRNI